MVIGIIGENCTGKSTLAEAVQTAFGGEILTGKDYLRLAKSESMAAALFKKKLKTALTGENVIYVISEQEHLAFLPEGSVMNSIPLLQEKVMPWVSLVCLKRTASIAARSTSHHSFVMLGFACLQASTKGGSSSSVNPISKAPIAFKAPTDPP